MRDNNTFVDGTNTEVHTCRENNLSLLLLFSLVPPPDSTVVTHTNQRPVEHTNRIDRYHRIASLRF